MNITEQKELIAASLWHCPATLNELNKLGLCAFWSKDDIIRWLAYMKADGWIFERNGVYHTYREFALSDQMLEYELS